MNVTTIVKKMGMGTEYVTINQGTAQKAVKTITGEACVITPAAQHAKRSCVIEILHVYRAARLDTLISRVTVIVTTHVTTEHVVGIVGCVTNVLNLSIYRQHCADQQVRSIHPVHGTETMLFVIMH